MSADVTPSSNPPPAVAPIPPPPAPPPTPSGAGQKGRRKRPFVERLLTGRHYDDEVVVYKHSHLFYWWPVWLLGFIFAAISGMYGQRMAIIPSDTVAAEHRKVELEDGTLEERAVYILPKGKHLLTRKDIEGNEYFVHPRVAPHRQLGTIYLFVLLLVVLLTNVSLRGLYSLLVVMILVFAVIILFLANSLGTVFRGVGLLSIYINMGGYFLISTVLFILWAVNYFILDRMTYMVFTPGQVRVRLTIGGGETVYDATNMTIQKQRADLFRHWGLGFGSGDLLVWPANVRQPIDLPNVLRVGRVVREIERMVKEKVIVAAER